MSLTASWAILIGILIFVLWFRTWEPRFQVFIGGPLVASLAAIDLYTDRDTIHASRSLWLATFVAICGLGVWAGASQGKNLSNSSFERRKQRSWGATAGNLVGLSLALSLHNRIDPATGVWFSCLFIVSAEVGLLAAYGHWRRTAGASPSVEPPTA